MTRMLEVADFRRTCPAVMDDVAATGDAILITKRGKPIARLVPVEEARPQALGCLRGVIEVLEEDLTLPAWNVSARKGRR